ncbi:isochorismate pyruvate lyase [Deinobacterium chartae]|uniref:Isochorismate pyruvate lyase n=1 Tax=Deinobacterium chartae TaxID=521158 RepID=A0A841HX26_9DEIO|nr:isochorismate pyruvate lyase [Deinobacterium chartae]
MSTDHPPHSLERVRAEIDRLDHEIVRLLGERYRRVLEAARLKAEVLQVAAPERQRPVIARAEARALEVGLPPQVAHAAYAALIAEFVRLEEQVFSAHRDAQEESA